MANGRRVNQPVFPEIAQRINAVSSFAAFSADDIVEFSEKIGRKLAKDVRLKTNQIRKFFDTLKSIQAKTTPDNFKRESVILLKPKLAYAAGRQRQQVGPLMEVVSPAISKVTNYDDFVRFVQFVESIVAYHKYEGGSDY